jgi:hypothetical protein
MASAFPGPSNTTTQVVGRDSFLDALDNNSLRVRILEHEPQTLDDTLRIACRLEAYYKSAVPTSTSDDCEDGRSRERGRHDGPWHRVRRIYETVVCKLLLSNLPR